MMHNMQLKDYLAKNSKKHLIFDWDGTIALMEIDWSHYHQKMAEVFVKFDEDFYQRQNFHSYEDYNDFVREYGVEVAELIKQANQSYEEKYSFGLIPNQELVDFIKHEPGYHMYLYSSNSRQSVLKGLSQLDLTEYFESIVTRDEVTFIKPDPDGFQLLYDPQVPKSEYLMIGNSHADEDMAQAVEIDFFLVDF